MVLDDGPRQRSNRVVETLVPRTESFLSDGTDPAIQPLWLVDKHRAQVCPRAQRTGPGWDGWLFRPEMIPQSGRPKHQIKRPARGSPGLPRSSSPARPRTASLTTPAPLAARHPRPVGCWPLSEFHLKVSGTDTIWMTLSADKMSLVLWSGREELGATIGSCSGESCPVLPTVRLLFDRRGAIAVPLGLFLSKFRPPPNPSRKPAPTVFVAAFNPHVCLQTRSVSFCSRTFSVETKSGLTNDLMGVIDTTHP